MRYNGISSSPNGSRHTHNLNGTNCVNLPPPNQAAYSPNQAQSQTAYTNFYNGKKKNRTSVIHENESNKLKAIINRLERKAEDRKISLKQLYTI